ncbi:MAG: phosphoribosyltransferase family protein [Acidobacteriota bacterium]
MDSLNRARFPGRIEAGRELAPLLERYGPDSPVLLAIPRGGIEVAYPVALHLKAPLDVIIPRKIPSPDNPELALGAVMLDGSIELNQALLNDLGLSESDVQDLIRPVQLEIRRRFEVYRGSRPFPDLKQRTVVLIDDGLATGYTMMAGIRSVQRAGPAKVVVAVPVSPESTFERMRPLVDDLVVISLGSSRCFAVSAFYQVFVDRTDSELVAMLNQANLPECDTAHASV